MKDIKASKNEIKAVKKTIKMWKWLAKNPGKDKEDWLEENLPMPKWPDIANCFLCDIWFSKCQRLLIFHFHLTICPLDSRILYCKNNRSPFKVWKERGNNESYQALRIVEACNRWLKKYERK